MSLSKSIVIVFLIIFVCVGFRWWTAPRGEVLDAGMNNIIPCIEFDPIVFHRRRPNCSGWGTRGGRRVFHVYNKHGLRDKDYSKKSNSIKRILILGASDLAGPGLDGEKVAVRVWERLARMEGKSVELINGATDAYFTLHSRMKLNEYLQAYHPDIVVHYLAARNGIFTDAILSTSLLVNNSGSIILARHPFDHYSLFRKILKPAVPLTTNWLEQISIFEQIKRAKLSWLVSWGGFSEQTRIGYLLDPTISLLREMQQVVEGRGGRFYVLWNKSDLVPDQHVPPGMNVERIKFWNKYLIHGFRFSAEQSTAYLRASGLPIVEIYEPRLFNGNWFSNDFHWNEEGAALFAKLANAAMREYF